MLETRAPAKDYCNCLAQNLGLDPVGYAGDFLDSIVVEVPLPWKRDLYYDEKVLPQGIRDVMALWQQHYAETGEYRHRPLVIAPDPQYSRKGYRRVMFYTHPAQPFAAFEKVEYQVPEDALGPLIWALYQDQDALPGFAEYRVPEAATIRDILVCTHGTIDAACARFGYPLYKHMRETYASEQVRVWRVSHFGGHVFAPTLMDMPTGHYWAYLGEEQAAQIMRQIGDVAALRGNYRGWAGLSGGFLQTAECDLWQRYGWDWFHYHKSGEVLAQDPDEADPLWAEVQIQFEHPTGTVHKARARVEVHTHIETISTTGYPNTYNYPQYRVTEMEIG